MKTIRDWFFCQVIPKSLLSARPLNFPSEDPPAESNQGTSVVLTSEHACSNSPQSMNTNNVNTSAQLPSTAELVNVTIANTRDPLIKLEGLVINYLRLILRLNIPFDNDLVLQVLHRLQLASLIQASQSKIKGSAFNIDRAKVLAAQSEASGEADLDYSLKILVLGKTGVGKSSTMNSIFDQKYAETNAFRPSTDHIVKVTQTVKGIKLTVIDTPGLSPLSTHQRHNRSILRAVKRAVKTSPPDIVLYVERLDLISRGYDDFHHLKLITDIFGSSIWFNTILVMTHCSSALPEGSDGYPINYELLVKHCTSLVQHHVRLVVSDANLEIPTLLVENHLQCKTNREGEKILPNGEAWRLKFFLLCGSTKILGDANKLLKLRSHLPRLQISTRSPSLPHLLSMLLRQRSQGSGGHDGELDESLDVSDENGDEYDKLPPIRILSKSEFQRLTKSQRNDYLDELEYRETLYLKKQWKEERQRQKETESSGQGTSKYCDEEVSDLAVGTPIPDMVIPFSFDSEHPVYRYRSLLYNYQHVVRPVLDPDGWDHDINFDGINLESSVCIKKNLNALINGQMSKDKKELKLQAETLLSYGDPKGPSFSAAIDLQTTGRDMMYTVRGDAAFKNSKHNTAGIGLSLTSLRDTYLPGVKLEDMLALGSRFLLHLNAGSLSGCGQVVHGGGFEVTIGGRDYPVKDERLTFGMSLISFEKEMVCGGNSQLNFRAGRGVKISTDISLNSRRMGHVSIKTSTSEHIELAFAAALLSIVRTLLVSDRSSKV